MHPQTVIYRHRKENKKKCTLTPLEKGEGFLFYEYPTSSLPLLEDYVILDLDAPPLSKKEASKGLLLIDATWNYAKKMCNTLKDKKLISRSLPGEILTAYPRKQTGCLDPLRGLASIEALYAAYHFLGRETEGLLDDYYWKKEFLEKNIHFFKRQQSNFVQA